MTTKEERRLRNNARNRERWAKMDPEKKERRKAQMREYNAEYNATHERQTVYIMPGVVVYLGVFPKEG